MSKNTKSSKKSAPVSAPEEMTSETSVAVMDPVEVSASAPVEEPKAEKKAFGKVLGARDSYGFGIGTITGAIVAALASGEFTRKELAESILDSFAGNDEAKRKAVKTTISVTLSDVRSPFGKYHASRSLVVVESKEGKLSLDEERATIVKAAIEGGILAALRGKTGSKKDAILTSFGLPTA